MEFIERHVQFPRRKKITKLSVDPNNSDIVYADIERDEGTVTVEGTPINAENLNKGNWRDDNSLSFTNLNNDDLPISKSNETQIVTKDNGETWLISPAGKGPKELIACMVPDYSVLKKYGTSGSGGGSWTGADTTAHAPVCIKHGSADKAWQAPANGFIIVTYQGTGEGSATYWKIYYNYNQDSGTVQKYRGCFIAGYRNDSYNSCPTMTVPVAKGDWYTLETSGVSHFMSFVPAKKVD